MVQSIIKQEGCKYMYLKELYSLFPSHDVYIEPFLGTGVVALNHSCRHKYLNDHNKLIYYFFLVMRTRRGPMAIADEIAKTPKYKMIMQVSSSSLVITLARYVMLCCTSMYSNPGGPDRLFQRGTTVEVALERIRSFESAILDGCRFFCGDFRDFFRAVRIVGDPADHFVYCDPPYVQEGGRLKSNSKFTESDAVDLYEILVARPWKFAISCRSKSAQFWRDRGLKVFEVKSVKGRLKDKDGDTEYLACNYVIQPELF